MVSTWVYMQDEEMRKNERMRGKKANYCYYSTAREHKIWFSIPLQYSKMYIPNNVQICHSGFEERVEKK